MPILNKFERAPYPEHPYRCSGVQKNGQCPYLGVPKADGSTIPEGEPCAGEPQREKYCWRHGGNKSILKQEAKDFRLYQVALWKDKLGRMADSPKIKDLREDIGVLRMALENKLNSIKDEHDLILNTQGLTMLVREIRDTVTCCNKLELANGQMLDKTQAQTFVQDIIEILNNYITEPEILQMISEDMIEAYDRLIAGGNR